MRKGFGVEQLRLGNQQPKRAVADTVSKDRGSAVQGAGIPRHRKGEHFLKGPVPLNWLAQAARCGGKALSVAIILWYRAGLKRSPTVKVPRWTADKFDLRRHAKTRGLKALEQAGLVRVKRQQGCSPEVTLLDYKDSAPK